MLLIFTLVRQTDKSPLPEQTEIEIFERHKMVCSGSPKRFSQVFGSMRTEGVSQWYQPSSRMTCRVLFFFFPMAAFCLLPRHSSCYAAHTPQSYTGYSLFQCPCAHLLGIADRWARPAASDLLLMSHENREGWERQEKPGLCHNLPKHFSVFSLLPVKKAPVGITLHFII